MVLQGRVIFALFLGSGERVQLFFLNDIVATIKKTNLAIKHFYNHLFLPNGEKFCYVNELGVGFSLSQVLKRNEGLYGCRRFCGLSTNPDNIKTLSQTLSLDFCF